MVVIEFILLSYFFYVVIYAFAFSIGGHLYKAVPPGRQDKSVRFAVLIPSYKEDSVILEVASKALLQNYPKANFRIFVIADSLQQVTIDLLRKLPITVIEVSFEKSTKVKSLNESLKQIGDDQFDYAVILDADNVMEENFLLKMNTLISEKGFKAIQGQRKPKNQNNNLAFLDGVSEAINNHIYRQGHTAYGLSASISGSGVAFELKLLKDKLSRMTSIGGFDRELELKLLIDGISVYYYKDAVVYDEKISKAQAFGNQRKRWISSQYFYLRKYFSQGCLALVKGDFTFFNSAVLRNIQLPRLINLGLLALFTLLSFFLQDYLIYGNGIWILLFTVNCVAILMAIPKAFYSRQMLSAVVDLPGIFMKMFLLLFRLKNANKKFIHTQHGVVTQE